MIGKFPSYQTFWGKQNSQYSLQVQKKIIKTPIVFGKHTDVESDLDKIIKSKGVQNFIDTLKKQSECDSCNPSEKVAKHLQIAQKLFAISQLCFQEAFESMDQAMCITQKNIEKINPELLAKVTENYSYMASSILGTKDTLNQIKQNAANKAVKETFFLLSAVPHTDSIH